jgi:hypothetical protein
MRRPCYKIACYIFFCNRVNCNSPVTFYTVTFFFVTAKKVTNDFIYSFKFFTVCTFQIEEKYMYKARITLFLLINSMVHYYLLFCTSIIFSNQIVIDKLIRKACN